MLSRVLRNCGQRCHLFSTLSNCSDVGWEPSFDQVGHNRAGDGPLWHDSNLISELGGAQRLPIPDCWVWLNNPLPRELLQEGTGNVWQV